MKNKNEIYQQTEDAIFKRIENRINAASLSGDFSCRLELDEVQYKEVGEAVKTFFKNKGFGVDIRLMEANEIKYYSIIFSWNEL